MSLWRVPLLILGLGACQSAERSQDWPLVSDSAGIRIVEHAALEAGSHPRWQVPREARLIIGGGHGPAGSELYRITSVRRAADGTIIASNAGTHEVRLFGPDGQFVRSFGREGDGPGEFRLLFGAWPIIGDSILTFDARHRRVQVFDRTGEVGRTLELSGPTSSHALVDVLEDGSLITYSTISSAPGMQRHVQSRVLFHRSASGELLDSLATLPWRVITPREVRPGVFAMGTPIFSAAGQIAVGRNRVYLSDARDPVVEVRKPSGALIQLIRWLDGDRGVSSEDRKAFRERRLSTTETEEERREVVSMLQGAEWADSFPALAGLQAGPEGHVWVQDYSPPFEEKQPTWWVFDREGRLEREVQLPEGFELHEVGRNFLLGITHSDLGVEQIRLYPREVPRNEDSNG